MREIKFRAWDGVEMRESFLLHQSNGNIPLINVGGPFTSLERKHDWVVMQYAGLKDSKGTPIYEGDILKWNGSIIGEVEFRDATFVIGEDKNTRLLFDISERSDELEVVGNRFQHPDLLQGKGEE